MSKSGEQSKEALRLSANGDPWMWLLTGIAFGCAVVIGPGPHRDAVRFVQIGLSLVPVLLIGVGLILALIDRRHARIARAGSAACPEAARAAAGQIVAIRIFPRWARLGVQVALVVAASAFLMKSPALHMGAGVASLAVTLAGVIHALCWRAVIYGFGSNLIYIESRRPFTGELPRINLSDMYLAPDRDEVTGFIGAEPITLKLDEYCGAAAVRGLFRPASPDASGTDDRATA